MPKIDWTQLITAQDKEQQRRAEEAEALRRERDSLLRQSDVDVLRALEQGDPVPQELKQYRQALRDLPEHAGFPDVELPERPKPR